MRDIIINKILIPSLQILYDVDYSNIYNKVSERNLCARLAHRTVTLDLFSYNNEREFFEWIKLGGNSLNIIETKE